MRIIGDEPNASFLLSSDLAARVAGNFRWRLTQTPYNVIANILITRRKLRRHAKRSAQFAAGRNGLDPLLLFERALLMVIGQPPARLDAEKRPTVRPQRHVRHAGQVQSHPSTAWWINIGKNSSRHIRQ